MSPDIAFEVLSSLFFFLSFFVGAWYGPPKTWKPKHPRGTKLPSPMTRSQTPRLSRSTDVGLSPKLTSKWSRIGIYLEGRIIAVEAGVV